MGSISLKDVTKVFGDDIVAVDGVNLTIEDGEFIVLVGPSGSGKSTILRLIAGLDSVTEGEIQLESDDITNENPRDRDLAMVFQNYALYPHLTTRQNIAFGLKMRGEHSSNEIEEAVDGAAEMMDIMELLEDYPNELSGGQQQRVALGRAVVREPKAFLMDEPLSNLDAKLRTQMRTEINQLQNDLGITTIYVTHDQTEAMTMGDRIVILNDGNIQQVATPLDAYYAPSNKFVAGFIGSPSMNFFDINFSWQDDVLCLQGNEFSIEVSPDFAEETPEVDTAVLGIRPEDIQVNPTNKSNTISAFVEVVEPLGKEQIIYFELNNTMYTASVDGYKSIDEDEKIEVLFPESRIHLFDSTSGGVIKQRSITEDSSVALHRV